MIKKLFLITFLVGLSFVLFGCQSTEEKFQECKTICGEEMVTGGSSRLPRLNEIEVEPDYSGRNNCVQKCIDKYK